MITNPIRMKTNAITRDFVLVTIRLPPVGQRPLLYHRLDRTVLVICVRFSCWVLRINIWSKSLSERMNTNQLKYNSLQRVFVLVTTQSRTKTTSIPQTWPYITLLVICVRFGCWDPWFKTPRASLKEQKIKSNSNKNRFRDVCFGG